MTTPFDILRDRPLVLDGAMGTMLACAVPDGPDAPEELNLAHPEAVAAVHREYVAAGSDAITTNSFGASAVVLAEHGLADRVAEINRAAATIARGVADAVRDRPIFVVGDIGPTSKLPALGQIAFEELVATYREQIAALLSGGVDALLAETCQDPLQTKAAAVAAEEAFAAVGRRVPLLLSVTIEQSGTMLLGTEPGAAVAALAPYRPAALGMNCATGPEAMEPHLALLAAHSPLPLLCQPNAGIPENVEGEAVYPLDPEGFAELLADYAARFHIAVVGGCCGTTPEHIAALARRIRRLPATTVGGGKLLARPPRRPELAGLFRAVALDQEPRPFVVAEQTNANGSRKFRKLLEANDFEAIADVAQRAARAAHALDLCVAAPGRDEADDIAESVARIAVRADAALMIDSTDPDAIASALARVPGRAIINSINLEDGGARADAVLALARRFGAAVVALTIDEEGMAKSAERKCIVARRLVGRAEAAGLSRDDLLIDALTFTLASGDTELRAAGRETLGAVARIKGELSVRTILGVSNSSFGLPPAGRKWLTSVFLQRALAAGLDAAIYNPARVLPLAEIPDDARALCERLVDDDRSADDPLAALIERCSGAVSAPRVVHETATPEEAIRECILTGTRSDLPAIVEGLLARHAPRETITGILLPAMQEVGERFGRGELVLPFVLASAETMRAAIDCIAPHLESDEGMHKGTIVLATVRGDVHDIGKNLVDIILANNGFRVINLGIRQPAQAVIEAAEAESADAIGLSGLLVSSTEIMRQDLEAFRHHGLTLPVLCGGAALTPGFVAKTLAAAYGGEVHYCADAFDGLKAMERIAAS